MKTGHESMDKTFNWQAQRVIVTGGGGFLGSHLVEHLQTLGAGEVIVPRSRDYDLRQEANVIRMYDDNPNTTMVIHLAAMVGGIGANRKHPGSYFYDSLMMGTMVQEYARQAGIPKFVGVGTICSYPKITPVPFKEEDLWNGYPEETNASYGLAKKMLMVQSQAYRAEYGFNAIHLMPTNLYGTGDHFHNENAHVIPDLIRKMIEAQDNGHHEIVLWGDGSPTREFLYVKDAAEGIALATAHYNEAEPVNIGSGNEISIKELAETIAEEVGYNGSIRWDTSKPNGQPRRQLDVSRAEKAFGFRAHTPFREGLRATIEWYKESLTPAAL
jgi:GDP-L-fucose synthase